MRTETVTNFVSAINAKDLNAMKELWSEQHQFVDSSGNEFNGKQTALAEWESRFVRFPDYSIEIEKQVHHGTTVAVFGFVVASFDLTIAQKSGSQWRIPVSWKAVVEKEKISLWQVYGEDKLTRILEETKSDQDNAAETGVQGFGGVFFKSANPKALTQWYDKHLGTKFGTNSYSTFKWRERINYRNIGRTEFSVFSDSSNYFAPSEKPFMFNFRVKNLDALLLKLKTEGVQVEEKVDRFDYGNFAWIIDLEGNKIELWEPVDEVLESYDLKN